jgi:hypothetical protein
MEIMSSEWLKQANLSSEEIHICTLLQPFNANATEPWWMFYTIL